MQVESPGLEQGPRPGKAPGGMGTHGCGSKCVAGPHCMRLWK